MTLDIAFWANVIAYAAFISSHQFAPWLARKPPWYTVFVPLTLGWLWIFFLESKLVSGVSAWFRVSVVLLGVIGALAFFVYRKPKLVA